MSITVSMVSITMDVVTFMNKKSYFILPIYVYTNARSASFGFVFLAPSPRVKFFDREVQRMAWPVFCRRISLQLTNSAYKFDSNKVETCDFGVPEPINP